jgi:hypothetical protein
MKKIYTLLAILSLPAILLLYANSGGSQGGYTGSPGDGGNTCVGCHSGNDVINQEGWITSDIPSEGYTPGLEYTITITGNHENVQKFGFELTAEADDQSRVGEFIILDTRTQHAAGNNQRVTHTSEGTTPTGDSNSWETTWVAPENGAGKVTFYTALNAGNGNGSTSGDQIYTSKLAVNEASTGIAGLNLEDQVEIYPNPANSAVNITIPVQAEVSIIDITGQEVITIEDASEKGSIDVSSLSKGIYFVRISSGTDVAIVKMLKN